MNLVPEIMARMGIYGMRRLRGGDRLTEVARVMGWSDGRRRNWWRRKRKKKFLQADVRVETRDSKTRKLLIYISASAFFWVFYGNFMSLR